MGNVKACFIAHDCTSPYKKCRASDNFEQIWTRSIVPRTLEVETAMCNTITASKSVLPFNISTDNNSVIHFCWDNFDLNEETPSGLGTKHSTHGIVIQEVTEPAQERDTGLIQTRERQKVILPDITELQPCFVKPKSEPNVVASQSKPLYNFNSSDFHNFIWVLCRNIGSAMESQTVPPWTGWISKTSGQCNPICSTVEYKPPINFSINDNASAQHMLEISKEVGLKVGLQYIFVTFNLEVAKKRIFYCLAKSQSIWQCYCPNGCIPHNMLIVWCDRVQNERQWINRNCY